VEQRVKHAGIVLLVVGPLARVDVCVWLMVCSDLQNKKGNILQASVDYIKRLKREQRAMSELVARQDELEKTNRQLTLDIQV